MLDFDRSGILTVPINAWPEPIPSQFWPDRQVHPWLGPRSASLPTSLRPTGQRKTMPFSAANLKYHYKGSRHSQPDITKELGLVCSECSFSFSLHVVGNKVCLVVLCTETARRESRCPLYRVTPFSCTKSPQTQTQHSLKSSNALCIVDNPNPTHIIEKNAVS